MKMFKKIQQTNSEINIANNYDLDFNNNLHTKHYRKNKVCKNNNNKSKRYDEYDLFKIPFVKNIFEYLNDVHKELNHRSFDAVRLKLIKRQIYYYGIINDLKLVINKCAICNLKNITYLKKKKLHVL